jgi:hypothetical protein
MADSLCEYYVGHCLLSHVYLLYTTFRELEVFVTICGEGAY